MTNDHILQLVETCQTAAQAGGAELIAWRGRFNVREKASVDFVTDADLASETAIRAIIHRAFPDHNFIGEERPPEQFPRDPNEISWIVDPLDGTTNYIHGYPHYAVSVAVARGKQLLAGVVYDPVAEKSFVAGLGIGAWCNGQPLKVSSTTEVGLSLVAVSLPARVTADSSDLADMVMAAQLCRGVRRTGSAALNLSYVATGSIDAFWASRIRPWDVAAGVLLIREAGGTVVARDGSDFDLWNPHFITAGTPELCAGIGAALSYFNGG